jgi:hypothetical protein
LEKTAEKRKQCCSVSNGRSRGRPFPMRAVLLRQEHSKGDCFECLCLLRCQLSGYNLAHPTLFNQMSPFAEKLLEFISSHRCPCLYSHFNASCCVSDLSVVFIHIFIIGFIHGVTISGSLYCFCSFRHSRCCHVWLRL